jgi:hypothetical protein
MKPERQEVCCKNCTHFIEMEPDHTRLFSDRYGCDFHKLYDGEVSEPHWQSCPEHYSTISKSRSDKLKQLGI